MRVCIVRPDLVPPSPGRRRAEGLVSVCAPQRVLTAGRTGFAVSPAEQVLLTAFRESRSACELRGSVDPGLSELLLPRPAPGPLIRELPGGLPLGLHTEGAEGGCARVPGTARPLKAHLGQGWRSGDEHSSSPLHRAFPAWGPLLDATGGCLRQ